MITRNWWTSQGVAYDWSRSTFIDSAAQQWADNCRAILAEREAEMIDHTPGRPHEQLHSNPMHSFTGRGGYDGS